MRNVPPPPPKKTYAALKIICNSVDYTFQSIIFDKELYAIAYTIERLLICYLRECYHFNYLFLFIIFKTIDLFRKKKKG